MKKIILVTQKKDAETSLRALRAEGTVHIEHVHPPAGESVSAIREKKRKLERVIAAVEMCCKDAAVEPAAGDPDDLAGDLDDGLNSRDELVDEKHRVQSQIAVWEQWGEFDPADVQSLAGQGVRVRLCKVPVKNPPDTPAGVILKKIFTAGGRDHCLAVSHGDIKLPFETLSPPPVSLSQMRGRAEEIDSRLRQIEEKFRTAVPRLPELRRRHRQCLEELQFEEALHGKGAEDQLNYWQGFCPADCVEQLRAAARREHWGLLVRDPEPDESVPTLLKNPRWVECIKPVFDFMNILPGYRELDASLLFLVFFSIFTGILIGDAAYGLIFFTATALAHFKLRNVLRDFKAVYLFYGLSLSIVIFGVLSGTYFGQQWISDGVRPLVPWLRDNQNMMLLSFVIGLIHLTLAHFWRFILKMPSWAALGELGVLIMVWFVFFLIRFLILKIPFPPFAKVLLGTALVLILFFTAPNRNILKAAGGGVSALYGSFMSSFGDIISYVRLFAVGLASVSVADAFNSIAIGIGFSPLWKAPGAVLVLFLGHTLNLVLCVMGVLVHGIRLNLLEFSSHLGVEWKGNPFKPLAKVKTGNY